MGLQIFTAVEVQFSSSVDGHYQIQSSPDMAVWTDLPETITGDGSVIDKLISTRGTGQIRNDTVKAWQVKVGRRFKFGRQEIETALNVFNVLNAGSFQQYATGANRLYAPADYMRKFNRQPPRAFQFTIVDRF